MVKTRRSAGEIGREEESRWERMGRGCRDEQSRDVGSRGADVH